MTTSKSTPNTAVEIQVAAAAVFNDRNQVLIAQRPAGKHMAGYWEFPGGKLELGEQPAQALIRELREETGIDVTGSEPVISLCHRYPDRQVRLYVRRVRPQQWFGVPQSLDQQALAWVAVNDLPNWQLLPADGPIVTALRLPQKYAITGQWPMPVEVSHGGPVNEALADYIAHIQALIHAGHRLIQLRLPVGADQQLAEIYQAACRLDHADEVDWLLNTRPEFASHLGAEGVHLSSTELGACVQRPTGFKWVAASCHSPKELAQAQALGCDFAVLGPLSVTTSHPNCVPIGEQVFERWLEAVAMPVFALGGLKSSDLPMALGCGAQGVAGISAFW